jgi:acyl-homoserine-lactone acylase
VSRRCLAASAAAALGLLAGCASAPGGSGAAAVIERTAFNVAHVTAPDLETLAYGVAYAHAEDNACQTAQQLVTVRGERGRWFGAGNGLFGLRSLPNEQIDLYVAAILDDAALARAWAGASADAQAVGRGYVAGWNRFLADRGARLPAPCAGQPWVRPMTLSDWLRLNELTATQAGIAALADGVATAQPPQGPAPHTAAPPAWTLADATAAFREAGLVDPALGSNAWALGREVTADGRGLLLGNPHFPWVGVNRFWQSHLTIPGRLDVMGAGIGHFGLVQIGFNRDVAWSHTVSTGRRFTLHELKLVPGDPTAYLVDGRPEKMSPKTVTVQVPAADGKTVPRTRTFWSTRWGPLVVMPRAGLNWTAEVAYAVQDANTGNVRGVDTWLGFAAARSVDDMTAAMRNLGIPWVNTLAADRAGRVLYADASVVPDVDAAQLERCAPSAGAKALLRGPGIVVLDGSRSDCGWHRDAASPVPGLTPLSRLPVAVRSDWVQNSNDSFVYAHFPEQRFDGISPLVGDAVVRRPRTRAGLAELTELLAAGKATPQALQGTLFANRSIVARLVLADLLAGCGAAPAGPAREGCEALRRWDGRADLESRGLHLFTDFWQRAQGIPNLHRTPADPSRPAQTPAGLRLDDPAIAAKVWEAMAAAVAKVRGAGFSLDAPLWAVQVTQSPGGPIPIHGGDEHLGVLNKQSAGAGLGADGLVVDHGTSYVQTVGFDERGPVAQALLVYGQSSDPASPHAFDQMRLYARKQWPVLPFHREDVERARIAPPLTLVR